MKRFDRIRAVVFDAVGTLLHPEPAVAEVYAEAGRRHGSTLDPICVNRRFRAAFAAEEHRDRTAALTTSESRERQRWQTIVETVFDDVPLSEGLFAELWEHFARPSSWRIAPDAAEVLTTLTCQGLIVGLASNFDTRLNAIAAEWLPWMIGRVIVSSEVGYRKPHREFFAAVERVIDVPAATMLFIGDDRENDFDGASAAGMSALLLDPRDRHADISPRIRHLGEIPSWLPS